MAIASVSASSADLARNYKNAEIEQPYCDLFTQLPANVNSFTPIMELPRALNIICVWFLFPFSDLVSEKWGEMLNVKVVFSRDYNALHSYTVFTAYACMHDKFDVGGNSLASPTG